MKKVRLIIRMYTEGVSKKTISEKSGCSRNTVKKYIRQFIALGITFEVLRKLSNTSLEELFKTDPSEPNEKLETLKGYFPEMEKALKRKGITREYLWQKYISEHPDGYRVSIFKEHYNRWRKQSVGVMHIEHKAGDKMQVDYADASISQKKEDFIQSCENALHYFGGVPQAIITDNLKSAVIKSDKYEPTLNEAFRDFTLHYGLSALPAGPYKPRHKALVEGMVKIIYRVIYPEIRKNSYTNLADLNRDILTELDKLNNQLLKGRPYSRRMLFEETERKTLQPLPLHVFEISYHIGSNMLTAHRPGDDVTSEVKLLPEGGKIRLELLLDRGSVELYANDGLIPMSFFYISNKENKTISLKCSNGALYLNSMDVYEMNSIWNN